MNKLKGQVFNRADNERSITEKLLYERKYFVTKYGIKKFENL